MLDLIAMIRIISDKIIIKISRRVYGIRHPSVSEISQIRTAYNNQEYYNPRLTKKRYKGAENEFKEWDTWDNKFMF